MEDLLGSKFITKEGEADSSCLKSPKVVALYFSAHWCPPCRGFTPVLAKFYNEVNKDGKQLEIVFLSSDQTEDKMKAYFAEQPWICLPFGDPHKAACSTKFGVKGIPSLVVLNKDGTAATTNGRSDVMSKGPAVFADWVKLVK